MTAIIAGRAKGRHLDVPPALTRPTSSRVKEAIFSRLQSWNAIDDADVLDLYAGSGALGFEAWSRGATFVEFVDDHRPTTQLISKNATKIGCQSMRVHSMKALTFLSQTTGSWDLVFADPPYAVDDAQVNDMISLLADGHLRPFATLVIERPKGAATPTFDPTIFTDVSHKKYGDTVVHYACYNPKEDTQ